jgi:hypothetical protein
MLVARHLLSTLAREAASRHRGSGAILGWGREHRGGFSADDGAHATGGDNQQSKYGLRGIVFFAAVAVVICLVAALVMLGY